MFGRQALLALLFVAGFASAAAPAPTSPPGNACWCKFDPAVRQTRRDGVYIQNVFYARKFTDIPYLTDPQCPNIKVLGVHIKNFGGPTYDSGMLECDARKRLCPIPALPDGEYSMEIRCDGWLGTLHASLGEGTILNVINKGPRVNVTASPGDGAIMADGTVRFAGDVAGPVRAPPPTIYADIQLSGPRGHGVAVSTRVYAQSAPSGDPYFGIFKWTISADLTRFGVRRAGATIVAEDTLGNRTVVEVWKSTPTGNIAINTEPPVIEISTPTAGQALGHFPGVSGVAKDSLGIKEISVSVYEKLPPQWNGKENVPPAIASQTFEVSGKLARFSFDGVRDQDLRQDKSYVVSVAVRDGLGQDFPATKSIFTYRNPNFAIILNRKSGDDETVRAIESSVHGSTPTPALINVLISALYNRNERVSYAASQRLSQIGRPALLPLLRRLPTGDGTNVPYIVNALRWMPADLQDEAIPELKKYLTASNRYENQVAARALGGLIQAKGKAFPLLLDALGSNDPTTRILASQSIVQLQIHAEGAAAVPMLAGMVSSGDTSAAYWAVEALESIGAAAQSSLVPLLQSDSTQTVVFAALALAKIGDPPPAGLSDKIAPALHHEYERIRLTALVSLQALGPAARPLAPDVRLAMHDRNQVLAGQAIRTLVAIDPDSPQSHAALSQALVNPNLEGPAAWAIQHSSSPIGWAIPALIDALKSHGCRYGPPFTQDALAAIGRDAVPPLTEMIRTGDDCAARSGMRALDAVGVEARSAAGAILARAAAPDLEARKEAFRTLAKIAPEWDPRPNPPSPTAYAETAIDPAPVGEIVSFLISQLKPSTPDRQIQALMDLAYLGKASLPAIPQIERIRGSDDSIPNEWIDAAIETIKNGKVRDNLGSKQLFGFPLIGSTNFPSPTPPIADDISVKVTTHPATARVGQSLHVTIGVETTTANKYILPVHRVISAQRRDASGLWRDVNVPVTDLYRGARSIDGIGPALGSLEPSHPSEEWEYLSNRYILDRPGQYRFTIEGSAVIGRLTDIRTPGRLNGAKKVRTRPITLELALLPRNVADSGRHIAQANLFLAHYENWKADTKAEFAAIEAADGLDDLLDYDAIPPVLRVIARSGTAGGIAFRTLAGLCDKNRVRTAILNDIEANHSPHNEEEALALAMALAQAETIPCRPQEERTDEDYVRWDYSRMRWEDQLLARLNSPAR